MHPAYSSVGTDSWGGPASSHHVRRSISVAGLILIRCYVGIFVLLGDLYNESTGTWNISGVHIVRQQDFWYVLGMTTWIALPWIHTRRVKIDIELVSTGLAFS